MGVMTESHPTVPWGESMPPEDTDYYLVVVPREIRHTAGCSVAICTRCGVPAYDEDAHSEFHRRLDGVRDAMSDLSS